MSTYETETVAEVERLIQQITEECKHFEGGIAGELAYARNNNFSKERLAELETQLETARKVNAETMQGLNSRLRLAQSRERAQREKEDAAISERAAKEKESIKQEMSAAWVQSGGDPADFEKAWPDMYQTELVKRTRTAMDKGRQADIENIHRNF
jgi:hypothetical protein